ncbi:hypothetical protein JKF63_04585 [Porcisia hertigi]|uniref:PH domain-containing protein n=1 Tax=Porcisia hertigi TaxID=2761500 RepID=A0A836ICT2_9TRYP|nr:hypothetical protein JKF63_04585 [Porcisia hertigi]
MGCPLDLTKSAAVEPPLCEGWLEKYALCRGLFSREGWHCRYAFVTHEGLGLCHKNPRDKGNCIPGRPLRKLHAKWFIPFAKKRRGEVKLQPVYVVEDVSAARHPAVPQKSCNGICSESVCLAGRASNFTSPGDLTRITSEMNYCTYYYFGITFEEGRKRYLLLLRTHLPQEYIKWTTLLSLYVHQGSASRIVPQGHPLEVGRAQPIDVNHRRLTRKRESTMPHAATFYPDPDPCSLHNYANIRRVCFSWDEGERERLFTGAVWRVRSLCGESQSTASGSIAEVQDQSIEEHRKAVSSLFEKLSPAFPEYEALHSSHQTVNDSECSTSVVSSVEMAVNHSGAPYPSPEHVDGIEDTSSSGPKLMAGPRPSTIQRPLRGFPGRGRTGGGAQKQT